MKKSITKFLTFFVLFAATAQMANCQIQSEFPKKCLRLSATPKKANLYSAIQVTTSTASISGVTIPVGLIEQEYTSSGFTSAGNVSIGAAYIWGAANITIKNDSTPILSGITYWGGALLYRTDGIGKHYIPGLLVGFNDFAIHGGVDYVPTPIIPSSAKVYAEISITANLMNLPIFNNLFKITPNQ